jgi:hypothetical protein
VSKELEQLRVAGKIGSALAAEVELDVSCAQAERLLESFGDDLRFVFITSAAQMGDYLRSLNRRFEWLGRNPLAGRERDDVHPGPEASLKAAMSSSISLATCTSVLSAYRTSLWTSDPASSE